MSISIHLKLMLAAAALGAAIACGSSSPTMPSPSSASATIQAGAFTPNSIDISIGSTVTWTNKDTAAHSVVADKGAFDSGAIAPGASFSYMFPAAGTVAYHDGTNPGMTGTVTVSGSTSPTPY